LIIILPKKEIQEQRMTNLALSQMKFLPTNLTNKLNEIIFDIFNLILALIQAKKESDIVNVFYLRTIDSIYGQV
jgi:hypothetical protein